VVDASLVQTSYSLISSDDVSPPQVHDVIIHVLHNKNYFRENLINDFKSLV